MDGHDATIRCDGNTYDIDSISYLGDSFSELSEAIKSLLSNSSEASCFFEHEPGRTAFRFLRNEENVLIEIYRFEKELIDEPWEKGEKVFECETTLKRLKSQYLNEAKNIIENVGLEKYMDKWGYEFPNKIYEEIRDWPK